MLASLHDIRLPPTAAGGLLADVMVAIGFACLAALLVVGFLRLFSTIRRAERTETLAQKVERLSALPDPDRRVALLHLLRTHAPDRYADIAGQLYKPGALDLRALEAEVSRLV